MSSVYINKVSKYLPNDPVTNDEMEEYLGFIHDRSSKSKGIVLRSNGIKTRYYALEKGGKSTHSNAKLTSLAIKALLDDNIKLADIDILSAGTTSPDNLLPSHASMVQGILGGDHSYEVMSPGGSCNSGMLAMKYGISAIKAGMAKNVICTGSEKFSSWLLSKNYDDEAKKLVELNQDPIVAFEKDFLRWMLSDGAGAALLQDHPNQTGTSLKVEWIDNISYANKLEACMYAGGDKENGQLKPWRDYDVIERGDNSVFSIKQDVKLLRPNIVKWGIDFLEELVVKHSIDFSKITYFLPHISSEYFRLKVYDGITERGIDIPLEKWFINLPEVGNVGAASIFLMLEELVNSDKLKPGNQLLLMVPESARFSYTYALLTVQ